MLTSAPAPQSLTRADLLRLGQAATPAAAWGWLPIAEQALAQHPTDAALRFLAAANYGKLSLPTPAREHLALLREQAGDQPDLRALDAALARLPVDLIPPALPLERCRANLAALGDRVPELTSAFEQWKTRGAHRRWMRAQGEEIVRQISPGGPWALWGDHRRRSTALAAKTLAEHAATGLPAGVLLEGIDPPWTLAVLAAGTPASPTGYAPAIHIVQADPQEFLDGLACADLAAVLGDPRVRAWVGPDASERLGGFLRGRLGTRLPGFALSSTAVRTRVAPGLQQTLGSAIDAQAAETARASAEVRVRDAARDAAWWGRRHAGAHGGDPLRVLIPTCRYTTYLRHSAGDLARALEGAGARTRVLIEPDGSSHLSALAYHAALRDFDPDLIVCLNYTRSSLNAVGRADEPIVPPGVPLVTWVQDAMPHLFRAGAGAAMGPRDFLIGHTHPGLFEEFGYPRERFLATPVRVSAAKFHPGPVDPALRDRLACEIAFVTHHSETPEAMADRLARESASSPALAGIVPRALAAVRELCRTPIHDVHSWGLGLLAERLLGPSASAEVRALVLNQVLRPLTDRVLRHQVLAWAADLADRRSWRLHIYGRGWDRHPTLSRFARGELSHDEELRASYACARVHLHVSTAGNMHQRIAECALSGGLPVGLVKRDDLVLLDFAGSLALSREAEPWCSDPETRQTLAHAMDHPASAATLALHQRLGFPYNLGVRWDRAMGQDPSRQGMLAGVPWRAAWLLGDPTEVGFWDQPTFDRVATRLIEDDGFREDARRGVESRARELYTLEALVPQVLGLVREGLSRFGG